MHEARTSPRHRAPAGQGRPAAAQAGSQAGGFARNWRAVAAWTAAGVVLYAILLQISYGGRIDSDGANSALQAWDLIHGHLLLRGWDFGDATFYTFELPVNGVAQLIFGLGPRAAHVASALVFFAIVACAVALAVTGARGSARAARAVVVVAAMAPPLLAILTVWTLIEEPDHPGTSVFLLVSALLIDRFADRASGGSPSRWWLAPVVCVILAAGQMGDATALYVGVPAVILASGYQILARRDVSWLRRVRSADGALILAAVVSVPLEKAVRIVMTSLGGYQMVAPKTALASPAQWPRNVVVVFGALRSLFGAVSTPGMRLGLAGTTLGWAGLVAAIGGTVWVGVRWKRSSRAEQVVALVLLLNLAVYVVSKGPQADGYREIAAVLPCGAVLGARTIVPAVISDARKALAVAAAAVLVAVVPLSGAASRPHVGPALGPAPGDGASAPTAPLTSWLEAHGIAYALSGYWSASVVTLQSGGRVQVRAITLVPGPHGYAIQVPYWEANSTWYDASQHDARYVIAQATGRWSPHTYEAFFGAPVASYKVPGFVVLEYPGNLLTRVLPMLGLGVGPKS